MQTNVKFPFYSPKSLVSFLREVNLIIETKPNQWESKGETKGRANKLWRPKNKREVQRARGKKSKEEETMSQIQMGNEG